MKSAGASMEADGVRQVMAFAEKIFRRADGFDEVVPVGFAPDWEDRPAEFRIYPYSPRISLMSAATLSEQYGRYCAASSLPDGEGLSLHRLGVALYLASAPFSKKMDISWNADSPPIDFAMPQFRRGSASGGGLYPTQIYLTSKRREGCPSGIYHYSAGKHALVPIRLGQWWREIANAVDHAVDFESYLVLSSDFWQNCFKYHNFGYHVCTEDIGAMLATLFLAFDGLGIEYRAFLSFDDSIVNQAIGADGRAEGALAIVGLGACSARSDNVRRDARNSKQTPPLTRFRQKSRAVNIPADLLRMHSLTSSPSLSVAQVAKPGSGKDGSCLASEAPRSAFEEKILRNLPEALAARKSAWGSMRGKSPMDKAALLTLLKLAEDRLQRSRLRMQQMLAQNSLCLYVQANNVAGIEKGAYRWHGETRTLAPLNVSKLSVWQSIYSMMNYNIDESSCIVFIAGNISAVIAEHGTRGYRIINACMGMLAQLIYLGAAAQKLDCGVVLGVRAQHAKKILHIDPEQNIFLAAFLGHAQPASFLFDFSLTQDVSVWR